MRVAIIPARGGSKRIPRKNIKNFCGKPMIAYSIEAAQQSKLFDRIIVSTDDDEIAAIAHSYGAEVPFIRPRELSDDYTATIPVIAHVIQKLKEKGTIIDSVCCIYATAPFIRHEDISTAYNALITQRKQYSFPVTSFSFPIFRGVNRDKEGNIEMFWPEHFITRSQDLPEAYHDAGQFYWGTPDAWLKETPIFSEAATTIVLPRHLVQDIDTLEDWTRAEYMYQTLFPNHFDQWNRVKQKIETKQKTIFFREKEIYFMSVGKNIGHESYGKENLFLRPVLIYKKLTHTTFLGIPLTSKPKEGSYFFQFNYKKDQTSTAMFNQMRVFDIRRADYYSGKIGAKTLENLEIRLKEFLDFTPPNGGDRPTRAQMNQDYNEIQP
jgi:pseudaminic acid cytidylyltransferase